MAVILDCILPSVAYRWVLAQKKVPVFHNLHSERFCTRAYSTEEILSQLYQPYVGTDVFIMPGFVRAMSCPIGVESDAEVLSALKHCFRGLDPWLLAIHPDVVQSQIHPAWDGNESYIQQMWHDSLQLHKAGHFSKVIQLTEEQILELPSIGAYNSLSQ